VTRAATVIGLGPMGGAIASALCRANFEVIVWNRSPKAAAALVAQGATQVPSAAEALSATPITVMCVHDYDAAESILRLPEVPQAIAGRTLVQLSTGQPSRAQSQSAWVHAQGGYFLAGGILAYPESIGYPQSLIVYSGDRFDEHREALEALSSPQYLGESPTLAVGAYFSLSAFLIGSLGLFFESSALARHYGVNISGYHDLARRMASELLSGMRDGERRIRAGDFDGRLASIDLTIAGMQEVCDAFRSLGMSALQTEALVAQLRRASGRGRSLDDIASLAEMLWSERQAQGG
jgi:3-hydroxyisobutyrate dehydrogenase-like beta-hydroxyacid dehydrogenase